MRVGLTLCYEVVQDVLELRNEAVVLDMSECDTFEKVMLDDVVDGIMLDELVVSVLSGIFVFMPTLKMISLSSVSVVDTINSNSVFLSATKLMILGEPRVAIVLAISAFSRILRKTTSSV